MRVQRDRVDVLSQDNDEIGGGRSCDLTQGHEDAHTAALQRLSQARRSSLNCSRRRI